MSASFCPHTKRLNRSHTNTFFKSKYVYVVFCVSGEGEGGPLCSPAVNSCLLFFSGLRQFSWRIREKKHHFHQAAIYLWDENITASGSHQNMCLAKASWLDTKIRGGGRNRYNKKQKKAVQLIAKNVAWVKKKKTLKPCWEIKESSAIVYTEGLLIRNIFKCLFITVWT